MSPLILVIDHDPDLVATVRHRLECAKFEVDAATDGPEGLEKAATEKPNLILLDLRMPAARGRDVLESLRKDNHQTEVPVIVWSTSAGIEDVT